MKNKKIEGHSCTSSMAPDDYSPLYDITKDTHSILNRGYYKKRCPSHGVNTIISWHHT